MVDTGGDQGDQGPGPTPFTAHTRTVYCTLSRSPRRTTCVLPEWLKAVGGGEPAPTSHTATTYVVMGQGTWLGAPSSPSLSPSPAPAATMPRRRALLSVAKGAAPTSAPPSPLTAEGLARQWARKGGDSC